MLAGYTALLAVPPQHLEMTAVHADARAEDRDAARALAEETDAAAARGERDAPESTVDSGTAPEAVLTLGPAARERLACSTERRWTHSGWTLPQCRWTLRSVSSKFG